MDRVDPELLKYVATEEQKRKLEALLQFGTLRKAAKHLGCASSTVFCSLRTVKKLAAKQGYAPEHDMNRTCPEGYHVKGVSTYYNEDGKPAGQWVKTNIDHERQLEIMRAVVEELCKSVKPMKPTALLNKSQSSELLNLYGLTDFHLGMHAWKPETGANWDLSIAERTVIGAFSHLIASSPNAKTGFLLQLGDFLHYDSMVPETPRSRHVVDTDSRFPKVIETAIRIIKTIVSMMLKKHEKVILLMAKGNHDPASCAWLQMMCKTLYEREPRIEVVVDPRSYYAYVHGRVLIGAHHGDKKSNVVQLRDHFYEEFRHLHGQTDRTYIFTGHLHHYERLPGQGRTYVERWPTIAARDAHGADYASDRFTPCITFNQRAEIGRAIFYPEMLGYDE